MVWTAGKACDWLRDISDGFDYGTSMGMYMSIVEEEGLVGTYIATCMVDMCKYG